MNGEIRRNGTDNDFYQNDNHFDAQMILTLKKENSDLRIAFDECNAKCKVLDSQLKESKKYFDQLETKYQEKSKQLEESLQIHSTSQERVFTAKMDDYSRLIDNMNSERENENNKKQKLEYQLTLAAKEAQAIADQYRVSKQEAENRIQELCEKNEELTVQNSALDERLQLITEEARKKIENLKSQLSMNSSQNDQSHLLFQYHEDFEQLRQELQDARDSLNESANRLEYATQEKAQMQQRIEQLTELLSQSHSDNSDVNSSEVQSMITHYESQILELNQQIATQSTEAKTFSWRIGRMTDGMENEIQQALAVLTGQLTSVQTKWIIEDNRFASVRKLFNILLEKITNGHLNISLQQQLSMGSPSISAHTTHDESYVPSITPPKKTISRSSSISSIPPSTPLQNIRSDAISYGTPSRIDAPNFTIDKKGDTTYLSTIPEKDRSQIQMTMSRDGSVNMVITPPSAHSQHY